MPPKIPGGLQRRERGEGRGGGVDEMGWRGGGGVGVGSGSGEEADSAPRAGTGSVRLAEASC